MAFDADHADFIAGSSATRVAAGLRTYTTRGCSPA